MAETLIIAIVAGKNVTIQPTRQVFEVRDQNESLRWIAQGLGVGVYDVDFTAKSPNAPITGLQEDPDRSGQWIGVWNTGTEKAVYQYSITVARDGVPMEPPIDPEIENDPPPPPPDEED